MSDKTNPSPDLYSLIGRRMIIASESDEGARISAAEVKRLSGGDMVKTSAPHDQTEISFSPTHKLLICASHLPTHLVSGC